MSKYKDTQLYKDLHKQDMSYGATGSRYVPRILEHIQQYKPKNILDFGCGKGQLKIGLAKHNINIDEYDPAISGKNQIPKNQYDLIITTDVLEHLYEEEISSICEEFVALQPKTMFHVICTRPAGNLLPDGTNAHKTVKKIQWWTDKIEQYTKQYKADIILVNPIDIKQSETSIVIFVKK